RQGQRVHPSTSPPHRIRVSSPSALPAVRGTLPLLSERVGAGAPRRKGPCHLRCAHQSPTTSARSFSAPSNSLFSRVEDAAAVRVPDPLHEVDRILAAVHD
uniref:Uncharacterized protein n=1 Tax=Oryza barthii TaxID=65489 RepID=A0A0D3G061_9ORYZ